MWLSTAITTAWTTLSHFRLFLDQGLKEVMVDDVYITRHTDVKVLAQLSSEEGFRIWT